jgi:hypothetical protein
MQLDKGQQCSMKLATSLAERRDGRRRLFTTMYPPVTIADLKYSVQSYTIGETSLIDWSPQQLSTSRVPVRSKANIAAEDGVGRFARIGFTDEDSRDIPRTKVRSIMNILVFTEYLLEYQYYLVSFPFVACPSHQTSASSA